MNWLLIHLPGRAAAAWWRAARVGHERTWTFTLVVAVAFAALQIGAHLRHELWRDEIHCWSVARNAHGLWDLLSGDRRYDGHPFLWYWLLHLISRITRDPIGLHLVSLAATVGSAVLWLRHAPLPRWLRVLLLASYTFAYEYGAMSRSYGLGVFLTFSFCALYNPLRVRFLALSVILALLASTSLYGTILAVVLGLFLFSRAFAVAPNPATPGPLALSLPLNWLAGLAVLLAGLALVAATTMPPTDAHYAPGWSLALTAEGGRSLAERYWWGMFPLRRPTDAGWIVASYLGQHSPWFKPWVPALVGAMLALWFLALRRSPRLVVMAIVGTALIALAQQAINGGWLRHWGHNFILLIASAWLLARETRLRAPAGLLQGLLALVFIAQGVTGTRAFLLDWQQPFSGSLNAARFIASTGRRALPILGDSDHPASAVAGYLDVAFHYAQTGDMGSTVVFHNQRRDVGTDDLLEQARALATRSHGVALIVANHALGASSSTGLAVTLLHRTPPALVSDEEFFVYEVRVQAPAAQGVGVTPSKG